MVVELTETPKNPIIIEGFPGFGFVSTIATEFLIKHLGAKKIGRINIPKTTPLAAIKNSEVLDPLEVYYDKKTNILTEDIKIALILNQQNKTEFDELNLNQCNLIDLNLIKLKQLHKLFIIFIILQSVYQFIKLF